MAWIEHATFGLGTDALPLSYTPSHIIIHKHRQWVESGAPVLASSVAIRTLTPDNRSLTLTSYTRSVSWRLLRPHSLNDGLLEINSSPTSGRFTSTVIKVISCSFELFTTHCLRRIEHIPEDQRCGARHTSS